MHILIDAAMANGWILHFMPFIDALTHKRVPGQYYLKLFHPDRENYQRLVIEDKFVTNWHDGDFNEYSLHRAVNGARSHIYDCVKSELS